MRRPRHLGELAIAASVLLLATLAMFGDVLVAGGERVLSKEGEDLATIFLYWQDFSVEELRHGHLPLWNPHIYSGSPYLASFQPALLYPPTWLGLVLSSMTAINVGVVLHVFLGGLWVYLWTRYRRLHPVACVTAGIVFMFCGAHFLQIYRGHLPNLRTLVWAPLILLSVDGWLDTRRARFALLGIAAVAMQILAGHIQEAYYTGLVASGYAFLVGAGRRQIARAVIGVTLMYVGGASIAAVQLLPGIDAAGETLRSDLLYEIAGSYSFPPENLLTLVVPGVFGDLVTLPYWGRMTLSEMCLFIGVVPFLLAVYGARDGAPEMRRYSLVVTLVVLILACGSYTPFYRFLYDYVPAFGQFRGTTKFAFLATLFIVMLAAIGLDRALRVSALPRWPGTFAAITGSLLFGAGAAVYHSAVAGADGWWANLLIAVKKSLGPFYDPIEWGFPFIRQAGVHAAVALAIGAVTFAVASAVWHVALRRRGALYALVLLGVVEVFTYARYSRPTFDPTNRLRATDQLRRFLARDPGDYRTLGFNPYVAMGASANDVYGYDPMLLTRYMEFLGAAYGYGFEKDPRWLMVTRLQSAAPLLGMLRLRYVVELADWGVHARLANLRELPRAFLVNRWRVIADEADRLTVLKQKTFDPSTTVLLETAPDPMPSMMLDPQTVGSSVHVTDVSTDALDIDAELGAPAVLVISDSYSAGWKATPRSTGPQQTYTVLPADQTLRAIPLAAGHHRLRLEYRPAAFVIGAWLTVVALVAYAAAIAIAWRRRRRVLGATCGSSHEEPSGQAQGKRPAEPAAV